MKPAIVPSERNIADHAPAKAEKIGVPIGRSVRPSQNANVPSSPPLTTVVPSGEHASDDTDPATPCTTEEIGVRSRPAAILIVPATVPIATREPSVDQANVVGVPRSPKPPTCPSRCPAWRSTTPNRLASVVDISVVSAGPGPGGEKWGCGS